MVLVNASSCTEEFPCSQQLCVSHHAVLGFINRLRMLARLCQRHMCMSMPGAYVALNGPASVCRVCKEGLSGMLS